MDESAYVTCRSNKDYRPEQISFGTTLHLVVGAFRNRQERNRRIVRILAAGDTDVPAWDIRSRHDKIFK
ncbi:hypothetical protein NPIL_684961 [Nephila pilipes]|uniref:Uncharacterized protein n=1 Tax=Nephila pilipes TaxID=299642 RepID=A0A8X6PC55_NEPPI|nr:hypothetical protein NPIL_684961 [Nephila pilipes]